ncbi:MAG TPA: ATP-binding protein [Candidatus Omnitrophota bacterium]|nr:ATP-binding protein [Candidatus Omnitrophota bacterium]
MIPRYYAPLLGKMIKPGRVLVIYGPRRVGKTTLIKNFLSSSLLKYRLDSGENIRIHHLFESKDFSALEQYAQGYDLIAIDEAQEIPNVGAALKILVDQNSKLRIVVTGSSSFDLAHQVGEPLTGRKQTLTLFPIAQLELSKTWTATELREKLDTFLIYGSYPEMVTARTLKERKTYLQDLVNSYLLKDILTFDRVRASRKLFDLLKLLAFQIGSEVSLNELGTQLGIDVKTVARYLDLLEKTFVIVGLGGLNRNPRQEVTSKKKYYFLDNGIRNAIILQFNEPKLRNDMGQLWENFIVVERLKRHAYKNHFVNSFFWRSYSQKEIDLVEEHEGRLHAYEMKWSPHKTLKIKPPAEWLKLYPEALFSVITPANYLDFIT